jgi:flagellar biosynthetic protein FlhB
MNLRLFAGEKTEKPTQKRRTDARKEGQVAKSPEIGTAFMFLALFAALKALAPGILTNLYACFDYGLRLTGDIDELFTINGISGFISFFFLRALIIVAPLMAVAMVVGLITNVVQVGWNPTSKPLMPKLSKLSPLKGFKRIFSMRALVDVLKSLAKFAVIAAVVYGSLSAEFARLPQLLQLDLYGALAYIANLCVNAGINVGLLYLFIAAGDYGYTLWKHEKDLKMSKQEVKDEYRNTEGDPQIKGKIKQKMREASMRRMMHEIPGADVIITNPTHYAVALKYEQEKGGAPVVVAKGADFLALKIKDAGKAANVPLVENKPLARALYGSVEIGREIPPELYAAAAEALAYVYRLKHSA